MPALDIYLPLFSVTVTSDLATIYGEQPAALTGDATVDVDVSTTLMQEIFQFQTDSTDIDDISLNDIKYKVVYTPSNPILPFDIDIDTSSNVASGAIAGSAGLNYNLTYDYVRFLAFKLFGTHLGVDLFNNESALRASLNLNFKTALHDALMELNGVELPTDFSTPIYGTTIMQQMLLQITKNAPSRLNNIPSLEVGQDPITNETWYKIPFLAGDKVYFNLTVVPHVDQSTTTTNATVTNRVYLIRGTLV